jgi:hypothetical protein
MLLRRIAADAIHNIAFQALRRLILSAINILVHTSIKQILIYRRNSRSITYHFISNKASIYSALQPSQFRFRVSTSAFTRIPLTLAISSLRFRQVPPTARSDMNSAPISHKHTRWHLNASMSLQFRIASHTIYWFRLWPLRFIISPHLPLLYCHNRWISFQSPPHLPGLILSFYIADAASIRFRQIAD